jgi:hypothetical protein
VAPLSIEAEAARRVRDDAQRLRVESNVLRLAVRRQLATTHTRMARAQAESGSARARCFAPIPSPWSELSWVTTDPSLERTLVPVD